MSGAEGAHGADNFDLLRRATQAMMSKSAAADDDGTDQIGGPDTPRSGVATPQPDLHDKRLPGIMSYFNQVRPASFKRLLSGSFTPSRPSSALSIPPSTATTVATPPSPVAAPPPDCDPDVPEPKLGQTSLKSSVAIAPQPPQAPQTQQTQQAQQAPAQQAQQAPQASEVMSASSETHLADPATTMSESGHNASDDDAGTPLLPHERLDRELLRKPPTPESPQLQDDGSRKNAESSSHDPLPAPPPPRTQVSQTAPSSENHPPTADILGATKSTLHPYPTPPASIRDVAGGPGSGSGSGGAGREGDEGGGKPTGPDGRTSIPPNPSDASWTFRHKKSISDAPNSLSRQDSSAPLAGIVTPSSVLARHFSIPSIPLPPSSSTSSTTQSPTLHSPSITPGGQHPPTAHPSQSEPADASTSSAFCRSASVGQLKKLTTLTRLKSGQSTPTRSLSTAQSQADPVTALTPAPAPAGEIATTESSGQGYEASRSRAGSFTPTPPGAQAPAPKGKLTIKIAEARALRRARDPYVVAVFQRSELISGGPRQVDSSDGAASPAGSASAASIPIQRQASDNGRTPMAIPMRSRQSSNTSVHDFASLRSRSVRRSLTNPKWDAEAVFDVVDSDMLVDVSVYDHSPTGEEFLGHVDFQASNAEGDEPVRGWFPLRGHADTMAENTPTGEIYVEAIYQRTDRKHFGPDDFQILRLIGKGTFGQVYQVRKKDTRRIYAMKVLSKKKIVQKKEVAHTVGERNILVRTATSDSPFIVGLKFSFQTPSDLYLVTDYMSGGELFWHLQKEGRFEESRAKFYIAELILAIQHLHDNNIVYRDLKPENILLDANGHIALCDFGLSKANLTKNDTTNTFCGTTEYLAPEVLLDEAGYTKMVDFWSLGVLVFEMCCGWSPFYAEDTQQMYKNIAFGKVRFPKDTLSAEGRSFVKGLLNRNPKHRLGAIKDAAELMEHPFFQDISWDALSKKLITPPFRPKLKSDTDVSYFDPAFTNAMDKSGSLNERAAALARGIATSTPLSPTLQANFQGFTFVDESALEDHMRGRASYNNGSDFDDEMHDAVGADKNGRHQSGRDDNDWDDINDIDSHHDDHMSGIVRTTTDEQMFGGSNMEL